MFSIKKFAALLLALCMGAFAMVAVYPAPASAVGDGQFATTKICVVYDGALVVRRKETCAMLNWSNQTDGTGVAIEYLSVTTPDGCDLINGYQKTKYQAWTTGGTWTSSYFWGNTPNCGWEKDHELRAGDTGSAVYNLSMCQADDLLWWEVRLDRNGGWAVRDKGHAESSYCA